MRVHTYTDSECRRDNLFRLEIYWNCEDNNKNNSDEISFSDIIQIRCRSKGGCRCEARREITYDGICLGR